MAKTEILEKFKEHIKAEVGPMLLETFFENWEQIGQQLEKLVILSDDEKAGSIIGESDVFFTLSDGYRKTQRIVEQTAQLSDKIYLVREFTLGSQEKVDTTSYENIAEFLADDFNYRGYVDEKRALVVDLSELSGWAKKLIDLLEFAGAAAA